MGRSNHCADMDCFFAAVAIRGRPELIGKCVVVCWSNSNEGAGEISTANYEARKFGIRAGTTFDSANLYRYLTF